MSLFRALATISGLTLLSRILGFIRDICLAAFLGAGPLTDAFLVAFKLPNFLRRLFAEGAFNAAFIPLFAGNLANEGRQRAYSFAHESFATLLWVLICLTIIAEIFMPQLVALLAPGFRDDPGQLALTSELSRITFPYLLMISLVALLTGVLNSLEKYGPGAAAPIWLNICLISALLWFRDTLETPAHALAWGVAVSGLIQFLWMVFFCQRHGFRLRLPRPSLSPDIRKLLVLMAPAALGAGIAQINLLIDIILATMLPNAVSYLYYADRVNQLPLGMIGVALGTALLPILSKQWQTGNREQALETQNRALELGLLFCLPCAAAMLTIAGPIISGLFQHGAFSEAAASATVPTLMAYAAGLPAMIMVKVFISAFYANKNTRTPVIIASISLVVNLALNLILMQYFAHVGLAMATSIAAWTSCLIMGILLYRQHLFVPTTRLISHSLRMLIACTIMMLCLEGIEWGLAGYLATHQSLWVRSLALTALVGGGAFAYGLSCLLCKALSLRELKESLRRKR